MDRWLEAYAKWPPVNQLVFSAVVLIVGLVLVAILLYVAYLVLYYGVIAVRGWPDDADRPSWKDVIHLNDAIEAYKEQEGRKRLVMPMPSESPLVTMEPPKPAPKPAARRAPAKKKPEPPPDVPPQPAT